jgi:DNA-binding transcriptional ArsR family regulator
MPAREKRPWNPGAATENQWSWSNPENWTSAEKSQEWLDMHPFIDGRAFILQGEGDDNYNGEPDPFLFVDYDDVADRDGTEPAPEAIELMNRLGLTYTDYSTSGTGLHQIFRGELPDDVRTIQFELPNGAGEIEIYDCKRVCIMTGKYVADTPVDPQPVDEDALEALADEHGKQSADVDRSDWEPTYDREELESMDGTDNIDAIFDAIQQVKPRDIRLRSDLTEERADGVLSFDPSWARSESGTRLGWDPEIGFIYRKGDVGLDALEVVALEEGIIRSETDYPRGEDWWTAVDELRDRGAHIPEYQGSTLDDEDLPPLLRAALEGDEEISTQPVSVLPLAQLDALPPDERRRAARKRGLEWPTTDEARDRLEDAIFEVMREEDHRVVDAPTSLGKTHTVAATRWGARDDVTGDRPVVHLLETRDARDEAREIAREHGGRHLVLEARHEACPVAAGNYDPDAVEDDDEKEAITVEGQPASEWLDAVCDGRGIPFSSAHQYLKEHNDQDRTLPCCRGSDTTYDQDERKPTECSAILQWERYREGDYPLVIATHNFAYAPGIRHRNNIVVDEEPDYAQDLTMERVRRAVGAFLREIDAPVTTWEAFVSLSRHDAYEGDAARERDATENAIRAEADREWYFENADAHTLAPALARAIFNADDRGNDRRVGKTPYEPPRLDANARDSDGWNREWVTVVMDDANDVRTVRVTPDFGGARSVAGLDAHPALPVWEANTVPWIQDRAVLEPEERQLWRRYERGLRVVQVGDATRPLASGKYFDDQGTRAVVEQLVDEYGQGVRSAITAKSVEDRLESIMTQAGIDQPELMHYGEEKSRNDFADEPVGFVMGSIDPGDDFVLDLLAELDLGASPERSDPDACDDPSNAECDHCEGNGCHECLGTGLKRAPGREFTGDESDTAQAILASVRENHTAQAAGRYAREPDDSSSTATVFVRTDAMPPGFADIKTPGVAWTYSNHQETIVEALRDRTRSVTARELADEISIPKRTVHRALEKLLEHDVIDAIEGAGPHGATLYSESGLPTTGVVDLTDEDGQIVTVPVWDSYTWAVVIDDADDASSGGRAAPTPAEEERPTIWDGDDVSDGVG